MAGTSDGSGNKERYPEHNGCRFHQSFGAKGTDGKERTSDVFGGRRQKCQKPKCGGSDATSITMRSTPRCQLRGVRQASRRPAEFTEPGHPRKRMCKRRLQRKGRQAT